MKIKVEGKEVEAYNLGTYIPSNTNKINITKSNGSETPGFFIN